MIGGDAIRGHIDLIVLSILERGSSYAYAISRTITERSGGAYVMKQTTLYTAVKRLEQQGQLSSEDTVSPSGKPRTYYRITPAGLAQLHRKREEWALTQNLVNQFVEGRDSA